MLYLVRHGQTEFNRAGIFQGRVDSPLTELGQAQARAVGQRLAQIAAQEGGDWRIESSPLGRTRQTAAIIAEVMGLAEPTVDDRLVEVFYGDIEGLNREQVDAGWPHLAGVRGTFTQAPNGEPVAEMTARAADWLASFDGASGVHRIAVAHASIGRVIRGLYAGIDIEEARMLETPQDAFHRLHAGRIDRIDAAPLPSQPADR